MKRMGNLVEESRRTIEYQKIEKWFACALLEIAKKNKEKLSFHSPFIRITVEMPTISLLLPTSRISACYKQAFSLSFSPAQTCAYCLFSAFVLHVTPIICRPPSCPFSSLPCLPYK